MGSLAVCVFRLCVFLCELQKMLRAAWRERPFNAVLISDAHVPNQANETHKAAAVFAPCVAYAVTFNCTHRKKLMWFCFPPLFRVIEHEFLESVLNWAPNNWLNSLNFLVIVLLGWINFKMLVSELLISLGLLPSLSLEKRFSLFFLSSCFVSTISVVHFVLKSLLLVKADFCKSQ